MSLPARCARPLKPAAAVRRRNADGVPAIRRAASESEPMSDLSVIRSPVEAARDVVVADDRQAETEPNAGDAVVRPSIAELHRRCIALEPERRCLAVEIERRRIGGMAEYRHLTEREREVIREIDGILAWIRVVPVQNIEDIAALLDLALDIELDAPPPDLNLQDRPWTLLLARGLRSLASGVEMSWLRRLSPPGFDLEGEIFTPAGKESQASARNSPHADLTAAQGPAGFICR